VGFNRAISKFQGYFERAGLSPGPEEKFSAIPVPGIKTQ
jgi:hypothetical protein